MSQPRNLLDLDEGSLQQLWPIIRDWHDANDGIGYKPISSRVEKDHGRTVSDSVSRMPVHASRQELAPHLYVACLSQHYGLALRSMDQRGVDGMKAFVATHESEPHLMALPKVFQCVWEPGCMSSPFGSRRRNVLLLLAVSRCRLATMTMVHSKQRRTLSCCVSGRERIARSVGCGLQTAALGSAHYAIMGIAAIGTQMYWSLRFPRTMRRLAVMCSTTRRRVLVTGHGIVRSTDSITCSARTPLPRSRRRIVCRSSLRLRPNA